MGNLEYSDCIAWTTNSWNVYNYKDKQRLRYNLLQSLFTVTAGILMKMPIYILRNIIAAFIDFAYTGFFDFFVNHMRLLL